MKRRWLGPVVTLLIALSVLMGSAVYGADTLAITKQKCTIVGTNKSDLIKGSPKADVICGLGGNDTIYGYSGNDIIDGGSGNDRIYGGSGNDSIYGGAGSDFVDAGTGKNLCVKDSGEKSVSSCVYVAKLPTLTNTPTATPTPSPSQLPSQAPSPSSSPSPSTSPPSGGTGANPAPPSSPSPSASPIAPPPSDGTGANPAPSSSASPSPSASPSATIAPETPTGGTTVTFESSSSAITLIGFQGDSASLGNAPTPSVIGSVNSVKVVRGSSSGAAGAVFYTHDTGVIGNTSKIVSLQLHAPAANQPVLLKLEDATDPTKSVEAISSTTSVGWQSLTFDFNNLRAGTAAFSSSVVYRKVVVFYAFGTSTAGLTYYIDNLSFNPEASLPTQPTYTKGALLWSDEFDGTGAPDSTKWTSRTCIQTSANGGGTCYNNEQQAYIIGANTLDGQGNAVINTQKLSSPITGSACLAWSGICNFSSGRFDTQGKVTFRYGVIEARIQNPVGGANWPAFWLLGTDITSVGWPASGEIDVMEGKSSTRTSGAIHWSNGGTDAYDWADYQGTDFTSGFHTYSLYWLENYIAIYVDGNKILEETPTTLSQSGSWAFNRSFFLILNNAVGPEGGFGGNYDGWTSSQMKIDYVRYYQLNGIGSVSN